ncbi:hypothetical protein ANN_27497 [Periplaneta americana]|uniref:Uncharacterized protein n=1 Tax=Periplaneta americana TaxID=6978 RepID=A0ABQ8RW26_PERAM|nr:hypothetical protein ANN_27497 [Periplaneta americana]
MAGLSSRKREDRAEHFGMARGHHGERRKGPTREGRLRAQLLLNAVNVERPSRLFQKSVEVEDSRIFEATSLWL